MVSFRELVLNLTDVGISRLQTSVFQSLLPSIALHCPHGLVSRVAQASLHPISEISRRQKHKLQCFVNFRVLNTGTKSTIFYNLNHAKCQARFGMGGDYPGYNFRNVIECESFCTICHDGHFISSLYQRFLSSY